MLSEFGPRQSLEQGHILFLVNINVYEKCYQNILYGSGVRASNVSTNEKCYLAILWARNCQHQYECHFYQNIPYG